MRRGKQEVRMSVEELESSYSGRPGLDRTPPQDVAAEMSVLGGMLLSKDAIADVIEQIRGNDFYRPAHEAIYDAIIDLYGRGEPADAITVLAELQRRGEHARVGGAPYLHDLMAGVPTAANAGYYARIVRERAIMRRLVEAGTRIVQMGYATDGGEVDDVVNNAQAEVYAVTERRASEDYLPLADIIGPTFDEIDAAQGRGEGLTGVPTGYSDFDRLTNGLHGGQMIVVAARPAVGKALALDTPLPTPSGWTTMGEVAVGDMLLAADGTPTRVVAATEVMKGRPCYEVEFDDGTVIVADAQHQWAVGAAADAQILTTEEMAGKLGGGTELDIGPGHEGAPRVFGVASVRPIDSVPVRCVEVENPSHLYLASRSMVPTHNSVLGINVASHAAIHHNLASVIFSLEMSRNEIVMRMLAAEARVPLTKMRSGNMDDGDWQKLAATMGKVSDAPLFIDDSPNMSLMEIRAKCRRLKQKHDLKLVVIDYLQLMSSGKRVESRQQEVSEFSRSLKLLAKELEVPVIAISQLNRGAEQRSDKKPQMSDLRESGSIEQDADVVILLHREDAYEKESPRAGEADLIVAKHRNGPTDVITVAFQGHYQRFVDMQV
ncbi:replicative DNA helicase [Promicromonospora sp. NPDC060271]|uniref:replicative DNA helicase n=1 Tax=Promicromonospora sp. NPDC060271 TaxID=3347089 RepID=UPI003651461A